MKQVLAPLIGDAETVTVIGLCKNAGKTTVLVRLIGELRGETLAMTSVGRDGERTDVVTGTEKPEIWVPKGTLFATARGLLGLCDTTVSVEAVTDSMTPLGKVAVFRALSDGCIQLAGPSSVVQLAPLARSFRSLGADRVLIDGAAGRKSLAGAEKGGCAILCVGASMDGGPHAIAAEAAHTCLLFSSRAAEQPALRRAIEETQARFALFDEDGTPLPLACEEGGTPQWGSLPMKKCVLWMAGGVTGPMLRALARRGSPIVLAARDATHFLSERSATDLFLRCGGSFMVRNEIQIVAVTVNPWSAYGRHLDGDELLKTVKDAVAVPVLDVKAL